MPSFLILLLAYNDDAFSLIISASFASNFMALPYLFDAVV